MLAPSPVRRPWTRLPIHKSCTPQPLIGHKHSVPPIIKIESVAWHHSGVGLLQPGFLLVSAPLFPDTRQGLTQVDPMKINGNSIRPGNIIEHQGRLWRATKTQHTQPGKGGAYLQVELKDIRDGTKLNERFRSSETVEKVRLDAHEYQFLFASGDEYTFMDQDTFEQITLNSDL